MRYPLEAPIGVDAEPAAVVVHLAVIEDTGLDEPVQQGLGELIFAPAFSDAFTARGYLIRFTRSGGRIDGFDVSAGRMLRIRFDRR